MKYKKYLKEKILEDGKIYEILNYQIQHMDMILLIIDLIKLLIYLNLFKIKMEEGIFLKFMVERIIEM